MILFKKEFPDLPGRNMELDPKEGKELSILLNLKIEEAKALGEIHGVNASLMINDALSSETFMMISKRVATDAFKPCTNNTRELNSIGDLIKELEEFYGFAIVNVKVATALQEDSSFSMEPTGKILAFHPGLYKVGNINNCEIFADPMMLWEDTRVCMTSNNFYNFDLDEDGDEELIQSAEIIFPKYKKTIKFISEEPDSKVFKVNNIQI